MLLGNSGKINSLVDESDVRGRLDSFCFWKTNGCASGRATNPNPNPKANWMRFFHSVSWGASDARFNADRTLDGVKKRL